MVAIWRSPYTPLLTTTTSSSDAVSSCTCPVAAGPPCGAWWQWLTDGWARALPSLLWVLTQWFIPLVALKFPSDSCVKLNLGGDMGFWRGSGSTGAVKEIKELIVCGLQGAWCGGGGGGGGWGCIEGLPRAHHALAGESETHLAL